ncbi:hypothetical protein ACFL43_00070 [Thermodesulfobacteriota bacterium]
MTDPRETSAPDKPATRRYDRDDMYEDDGDGINIKRYLLLFWEYKIIIVLCSVVPAIVVGALSFLMPRIYETEYTYRKLELTGKEYEVFNSRFYSAENLSMLADDLQAQGFENYAGSLNEIATNGKGFIAFTVWPSFLDTAKAKITDPEMLESIRKMTSQMLSMTLTVRPREDIYKIADVVRNNFENIIPAYLIQEELEDGIEDYKKKISKIQKDKFEIDLELKANRLALDKLAKLNKKAATRAGGDVVLQFDVGDKSEYLPLEYQIQAAESKIIELEKTIAIDEGNSKYYVDLIALHEALLESLDADFSIQKFYAHLISAAEKPEHDTVKHYIRAYAKEIENQIAASVPVTERPIIAGLPKGTVKKTAVTFVLAFMIVFVGVVLFCDSNGRGNDRRDGARV